MPQREIELREMPFLLSESGGWEERRAAVSPRAVPHRVLQLGLPPKKLSIVVTEATLARLFQQRVLDDKNVLNPLLTARRWFHPNGSTSLSKMTTPIYVPQGITLWYCGAFSGSKAHLHWKNKVTENKLALPIQPVQPARTPGLGCKPEKSAGFSRARTNLPVSAQAASPGLIRVHNEGKTLKKARLLYSSLPICTVYTPRSTTPRPFGVS